MRERRQQALQRHRGGSLSPAAAAHLQSTLQHDVHAAVQDVLLNIQRSPLIGALTPDAMDSSGGDGSDSSQPGGPPPADVDAFLADLERQIVAEMQGELEQLEAFEAAALAAAVAEREAFESCAGGGAGGSLQSHHSAAAAAAGGGASPGSSQETEPLLCPVCMGSFLMQRAGLVVCGRGCVRLNLAAESLSLSDLRARLGHAFEVRSGAG